MRPPLVLAALGLLCACDGPRTPAAPMDTRLAPDKARLFADARLVPTREGERIRHEVALAGEIVRALQQLPTVVRARANVELDPGASKLGFGGAFGQRDAVAPTPRVTLTVVTTASIPTLGDASELRSQASAITRGIVGNMTDDALSMIVVEDTSSDAPTPAWILLMGSLGLGFCGGVIAERVRRPGR